MESWSSEHNAFVVEIEGAPLDTLHRVLKDVRMRTALCSQRWWPCDGHDSQTLRSVIQVF
jgi:hypothetical protein